MNRLNCRRKMESYLGYICKNSTIHGLNIISMPNLHILERLFWITVVAIAGVGAIILTLSNWNRFISNPTVISIQKDFRNWENIFPAATGCFDNKVNSYKAEKFIKKKWGLSSTEQGYDYYYNFIQVIANATYFSFETFRQYENDSSLYGIDMADIAIKVHPNLTGTLVTVDTRIKRDWELILTELGVCFLFNSKLVSFLVGKYTLQSIEGFSRQPFLRSFRGWKKVKAMNFCNLRKHERSIHPENSLTTLKCHFLNGLCYARYDSDSDLPLKYYIHSHFDVAHITSKTSHAVKESEEMEINYKMIETIASPNIKYLSISQRKCRFEDEYLNKDLPVYSNSVCLMLCRYKMALSLCGCKPFFYHFLGGKVCDIKGLLCLSKYSTRITAARNKCICPQPCNLITYLPQVPKYTKWEEAGGYFDQRITFRWGLLHPTTKYKRDILFGLGDLIVSLGGTVNLFLGISFISLIEAVYLIFESIAKKGRRTQ